MPLILALSATKGRATFGGSGHISYTEYIDGPTKTVHWQGEPLGTGKPAHPTRRIFSGPAAYECAHPVPRYGAPRDDPSYWYERARPRVLWKGQLLCVFRA